MFGGRDGGGLVVVVLVELWWWWWGRLGITGYGSIVVVVGMVMVVVKGGSCDLK